MHPQQEAQQRRAQLPEAETALPRPHREEKGGGPGEQREGRVQQRGACPPRPTPQRPQQIVDKAQRKPQPERREQGRGGAVARGAYPNSRAQSPRPSTGSS